MIPAETFMTGSGSTQHNLRDPLRPLDHFPGANAAHSLPHAPRPSNPRKWYYVPRFPDFPDFQIAIASASREQR